MRFFRATSIAIALTACGSPTPTATEDTIAHRDAGPDGPVGMDASADAAFHDAASPDAFSDAATDASTLSDAVIAHDAARDAETDASSLLPPECASPGFELVYSDRDGPVILDRIRYQSGGLAIYGVIVRPSRDGVFPALVYQHGGSSGIQAADLLIMRRFAERGIATFASDYRGETTELDGYTSEGDIEACGGEVDDTLVLSCIAKAQPYVRPDRVVMFGGSHGGCITARAVQRGADVHAAAMLYPAVDSRGVHANYEAIAAENATSNPTKAAQYAALAAALEAQTGGRPDSTDEAVQAEWTRRSPIDFADAMPTGMPTLVVHGMRDELLNYVDNCRFVAAVGGFRNWRLRSGGSVQTEAPTGCESLTWESTSLSRPTWPGGRLFVMHNTLNHGGNLLTTGVYDMLLEYLDTHLATP